MARSDVILRAASLKESKASLHGELLDSEDGSYDEGCGLRRGQLLCSWLLPVRRTLYNRGPFLFAVLGKASRLDGRTIDEKAGAKEVINTRAPFSRRN